MPAITEEGEDVELAANRMPAYWTRLQDSAEQPVDAQPVDDLSLPVIRWCHFRSVLPQLLSRSARNWIRLCPDFVRPVDLGLKWFLMGPDELILRLAGALWLRNICKIDLDGLVLFGLDGLSLDHKKMD